MPLKRNTFIDAAFTLADDGDTTKKLITSLGGATAGKTMTIASSHTNDRTLTLPDATDTLVGRATTDTLTNKTLTSPVINTAIYLPVDTEFFGATSGHTTVSASATASGTLTLPATTDTLVGKATTDTLTNKTLTTPTIGSFANANHNHSNSAGGGQIANSGISGVGTEKLANPYKFSVYRNAAQNTGNGSFAKINFDTELFDTGSNFDNATNFNFTAPTAGFYQFNARASVQTGTAFIISLFKNGSEYHRGDDTPAGTRSGANLSIFMQLAANDTVDIRAFGSAALALDVGATYFCYFQGYLVSVT